MRTRGVRRRAKSIASLAGGTRVFYLEVIERARQAVVVRTLRNKSGFFLASQRIPGWSEVFLTSDTILAKNQFAGDGRSKGIGDRFYIAVIKDEVFSTVLAVGCFTSLASLGIRVEAKAGIAFHHRNASIFAGLGEPGLTMTALWYHPVWRNAVIHFLVAVLAVRELRAVQLTIAFGTINEATHANIASLGIGWVAFVAIRGEAKWSGYAFYTAIGILLYIIAICALFTLSSAIAHGAIR